MSLMVRALPAVAYPLVLLCGLGLHAGLLAAGVPLLWSTYVPVFLGMVAVARLEHVVPHDRRWRAKRAEVANDALFLIAVQVLLPKALTLWGAVALLRWSEARGLSLEGLWPGGLPVAIQVVLMVLTADLLRYWLHVLSHQNRLLWRLHSVHHSPEKLYWLNVGRFHPLEKALQFGLDALPFLLLGVREEVLAGYFVFYALNGFFQHSNVELRMGFLNWIVSGAPLHRWHHSRVARESNHNYGNNLIVWDVLFGTRFLPADGEIVELGLPRRDYPQGFLSQMATPFRSELFD